MARFKYEKYLHQVDSEAYDSLLEPGTKILNSGIYRCENCGDEIAANKDDSLPPQNHRQHDPKKGSILWRLVVFAQQQK